MTKAEFEKRILSQRQFNEKTLDLLWHAMQDTVKVLSKFITEEEIVKRIISNLKEDIIYKKEIETTGRRIAGLYSVRDKTITMAETSQKEDYDEVFLHEFLHCITAGENYCGFDTEYGGMGINEGITEYIAQKIRPTKMRSYGILTRIIQVLTKVIPEKEIIDAYFNSPIELFKKMEDKRNKSRFF